MIVPNPPVKLEGHCSVIHANTLYTYSANGFAAIPLERNGTWSQLPMGEPVSDAVCVTGTMDGKDDQHALYVIGGTGSSTSPGLQRYAFETRQWSNMQTQHQMENRTSHGAVFLKSPPVLLVYAGNQKDGAVASSDTFTINTAPPYNISSYIAKTPTVSPVLLPWSNSEAALVGGLTTAKQVHLFTASGGWRSSEVSLAQPLPDDVRCAIANGADGSKALESFNMNVSPNTVTTIPLLNPSGTPARLGTLLEASFSRKRKKREVPLSNYPTYDGALASSTTRSDYSLAQGDNGLVVISSGSGTDSLAIFNQTSNSWVNATKLFYGDQSSEQILASIATSTTTATATTTSSSTSTSRAASDDSSTGRIGTIIGATLGSLVGVIIILILILYVLHRTKLGRQRAGYGQDANDKDRLSFQDQGMEPLTRSAYPMAKSPAPLAAASVDSLAIFSSKVTDEKTPGPAGAIPGYEPNLSPLTPVQSSGDWTSPSSYSIGADKAVEAHDMLGVSFGDRTTDEGWGKYFQDNGITSDLASPPPASAGAQSKPEDRTNAWPMGTLTPLNFGFLEERKPLGRVITGSPTESKPTIGQTLRRAESQSARISCASSLSASSDMGGDGLPVRDLNLRGAAQHSWIDRPPSSTYSRSFYNPGGRDRDTINTRGSSVLIPDNLKLMPTAQPGKTPNSDLSWLNLNADR